MNNDENENHLLHRALKHMFKPLMVFLIKKQITLPTLVEIIKSAYVEVAEAEFPVKDKAPTDSRINLLTGVHRKDVKRLRDQNDIHKPSERLSINSLMLASWLSESPYTKKGVPQPLPVSGKVSFESLADLYSRQNIRASSILENWKNLGWVIQDDNDTLELNTESLQANQLSEDKLYFFAENLGDHMATSTHNLLNKNKQFERAVFFNGLTAKSIKSLKQSAKEQSMHVLKELNKEALALQKQDKHKADSAFRFRLGSYFYTNLDGDK